MNKAVIDILLRTGALRTGTFTLKSGIQSPIFIDLGKVASGFELKELGQHYARTVLDHFPSTNWLFGPAYKGLPLATATAIALAELGKDVHVVFDRKEAKSHGEGGTFIGALPKSDSNLVVIDDVVSSGETKISALASLTQSFGTTPLGVVVAVDRMRATDRAKMSGISLFSMVTLKDIATYVSASDPALSDRILAFSEESA